MKVGDRVYHAEHGGYIIAYVGDCSVALVSLLTGEHYSGVAYVGNPRSLTYAEFEAVCGYDTGKFSIKPRHLTNLQQRPFKVGDKVISALHGGGKIVNLTPSEDPYPLVIMFGDTWRLYTLSGKFHTDHKIQTLFHADACPEWALPKPELPDLKVDDLVWVTQRRRRPGHEVLRHFSHFDDKENLHYYANGTDSITARNQTLCARAYRIPTQEEIDEIRAKNRRAQDV